MGTAHRLTARIERGLALLVVAAMPGGAAGQNSWFFDVQYSDPAGVINSPDDTATVSLWAEWDSENYAFYRAKLDITADDPIDAGYWLKAHRILHGPGSKDGTIEGERVSGIIPTQLVLPPNYLGDTSNPILAWQGTWSTAAIHPREIPLLTGTQDFRLYTDFDGNFDSFLDSLEEGAGTILVVPAVATAPPFVLCAAAFVCRRQR